MKKKLLVGLVAGLFLAGMVGVASAALFEFSDRTSWDSSVSNITTEDFNALEGQFFETLSLGDVTFDVPTRSSSHDLWVSYDGGAYPGLGVALVGDYSWTSIQATFSPSTTAVATDIFNLDGNGNVGVEVIDDTGSHMYSVAVTNPNFSFFGITTDTGYINSISFTPPTSWVGIDNFSYGTAGQHVPEPATMLLFGTGLAGLVGMRRRKNKK